MNNLRCEICGKETAKKYGGPLVPMILCKKCFEKYV